MSKLTNEQITGKALELSKKYDNEEITPISFDVKGEQIIGYLREPGYESIMYATDKFMSQSPMEGAENVVRTCLLRDESDPRITSEEKKHAKIRSSFVIAALKVVTPYVDEFKKK